jgi:hypothetical protein
VKNPLAAASGDGKLRKLKMKNSAKPRLKEFAALRKAAILLTVSLGVTASAVGDYIEPSKTTMLWREWMSVIQREQSQVSGPRIYLVTDREILQTSPEKATFQNGQYRLVLMDGSTPDTDGDVDGYTDVFEDGNPCAFRDDPDLVPGNPGAFCAPLPRDTWAQSFFDPAVLADGSLIGLAEATVPGNVQATLVRPLSGAAVRVNAAPASKLVRPVSLNDYSTLFYYYYSVPGQTTGTFLEFPLSLYYLDKVYPNPGDANTLETTIVPGAYSVEFPTITNAPYGRSALSVLHRVVPNGSLTVGLKKPTWLVRSLKSFEKQNSPPVDKTWVNGRLKFDPYLPMTITWDDIFKNGIASPNDYIEIWLEDENQEPGLEQVSFTFRLRASSSSLSVNTSNTMKLIYGNIRQLIEQQTFPFSVTGHIVMKYYRYANQQYTADLSSVTVRVPIEMFVSYSSWRNDLFLLDAYNDSISGPGADPDGDGFNNQQEYEAGSDPLAPTIAVVDPLHENVTTTTATLGATVLSDAFSQVDVTIFERGVLYSESSINSAPVLDGAGVNRVPAATAEVGPYTIDVTGLTAGTQYSYRGYTVTNLGVTYSTPVSTFTTVALPPITLPTVVSPTSTSVTGNGATLGGNVTSDGGSTITERGVVYSITSNNDNPFIGGTGVTKVLGTGTTGTFTVNVTGLANATTYSFRAYAINALGTSHTAAIGTFTTPSGPVITSPTFANVTTTGATLGGNVTSGGGLNILQRGVVFSSTNANPLIGGPGVTAFAASTTGLGVFTVNASGLLPGTLYRFKAYAINSVGTAYTAVGTFTTLAALPTVTSPTLTNLTSTSATLGANATATGQSAILERGFVYSPTAVNNNPVVGGPGVVKVTAAGTTTGVYSAPVTGLSPNTGYTFRAFVRNNVGTAYSASYAFFTTFPPLTVTSPTVTAIATTTATLGGTVVSDGATTATGRGVVFSQDPVTDPVIGGPGVTQVPATGTMGPFTVAATGLSADTVYFFRAYATNASGTSYSAKASFRTLPLQLLGLAEVQWQAAVQPAGDPEDGGNVSEALLEPAVPHFVYRKDPLEMSESITYTIETTTDLIHWGPINQTNWLVDDTGDTLEATWISQSPPPTGIFFRVKGITE